MMGPGFESVEHTGQKHEQQFPADTTDGSARYQGCQKILGNMAWDGRVPAMNIPPGIPMKRLFGLRFKLLPQAGCIFVLCATGATGELVQQDLEFPVNAQSYQRFGRNVAIDGTIVAVGSPVEEGASQGIGGNPNLYGADDSGAAYIYEISNGGLVFQKYIKSSNAETYDTFGNALALSGNTLVVAAELEDCNSTGINGVQTNNGFLDSGAVYVFVRNGTTWTQQAYIKASNTDRYDIFGSSVAISGDTMVVGARGESGGSSGVNGNQSDNSAQASGAAYVFVRNGGVWTQQAYLKASNTNAGDFFGSSVAISGDTIVVGAPEEDGNGSGQSDNSATSSGAVYVFTRYRGVWSQQAYLKAANPDSGDKFGTTVAVYDNTAFVGAPYEASGATGINGDESDNSKPQTGAVYGFERVGAAWSKNVYIKMNHVAPSLFGSSIALAGDVVAVGAPNGSVGELRSGSGVSMFYRNNRVWSHQESIRRRSEVNNNATGNIGFGISIGISGGRAVIGDAQCNAAPPNKTYVFSGSVYLFSGIDPTRAPEIDVVRSDEMPVLSNGSLETLTIPGATAKTSLMVRNRGSGNLTISSVVISGSHSSDFAVEPQIGNLALAPNQEVGLTIGFSPSGLGGRNALLKIISDDFDESPYSIYLNGTSVSPSADSDGDGLEDYAEYQLSRFGFDRTVRQDDLVKSMFSGIMHSKANFNKIGYYTKEQLGSLRINAPLLEVDQTSGKIVGTIRLEQSTDLIKWNPFPLKGNNFSIQSNGEGRLSIDPGSKSFIRIEGSN